MTNPNVNNLCLEQVCEVHQRGSFIVTATPHMHAYINMYGEEKESTCRREGEKVHQAEKKGRWMRTTTTSCRNK